MRDHRLPPRLNWPVGSPETSVSNHLTPRNNPCEWLMWCKSNRGFYYCCRWFCCCYCPRVCRVYVHALLHGQFYQFFMLKKPRRLFNLSAFLNVPCCITYSMLNSFFSLSPYLTVNITSAPYSNRANADVTSLVIMGVTHTNRIICTGC